MKSSNKLIMLAATAGTTFLSTAFINTASAACDPNSALGMAFGCDGIFSGEINLKSIIALIFRILVVAAILWVVYNMVVAGITIAGAKEDADKRKNGLKSIINACIGLVVCLSSYAITNTVQKQLGTDVDPSIGVPCTGTDANGLTSTGTVDPTDGECKDLDGNPLIRDNT